MNDVPQQPTSSHQDDIANVKAVERAWRQIQELPRAVRSSMNDLDARRARIGTQGTLAPSELGDYALLREIKRGGQGIVYEATQKSTGRRVAVKVIRAGLFGSATDIARFEREVQLLVHLKHPNIVTVYDSGADGDHCYYVMDYIDGESLDEHVARHDLSISDVLRLFSRICDAVNVAHMRGVIHRDLKPGNIRIDRSGQPHVLDFGLAKVYEHDVLADDRSEIMTQTGQFVGSMPWASPEQALGNSHAIDIRTDVYAIGVLLYRTLTGKFPYTVFGPLPTVLDNILTVEPSRPGSIRAELDDDLDTIVLKCLRKRPEDRYQSAGELGRDIERYLAGEAIEAKRDSGWYMFKKNVRRHRIRATIIGLVLLLVVHSIGALAILHQRESRLRIEAQQQAAIAQAVNDFLNEDLLSAVQPEKDGLDVTVRQVLDAASERVEGKFADQPLVEAAIRTTLGNTYMELGDWRGGLIHAERALEIRRAALGGEHEDTLSSMNQVARLYRRLGRLAEAESLFTTMVPIARATLGNDHHLTTKGINNFAYVLSELGRHDAALALNSEILETRLRTLGPEDADTLSAMNNQAYYLAQVERFDESESLYAQSLEVRQRVIGPHHPDTLNSMNNLANIWMRSGRYADAERMQIDCLAVVRKALGENHPQTINSLTCLGNLCRLQGRYAESEQFLLEALATQRVLGGETHFRTAARINDLARLYRDQERYREASALLEESLAICRVALKPDHPLVSDTLLALAECCREQYQYEEAAPLMFEAQHLIALRLGPEHPQAREAMNQFAELLDCWNGASESAAWRAGIVNAYLAVAH